MAPNNYLISSFDVAVKYFPKQQVVINVAPPSVMSLLLHMRVNGHVLGSGTGFVLQSRGGPVLVTNRHIVTGRGQDDGQPISRTGGLPDELVVFHHRVGALGYPEPRVEPLYVEDRPLWREHPTLKEKADFVALPLTALANVQLNPHTLAPTQRIFVGPADTVSVVGFPFGRTAGRNALAIWATGFVASEPRVDFDGLPTFLIDCRARQGQSGSAVVAYRAKGAWATLETDAGEPGDIGTFSEPAFRLLGIYSGRINEQSDLGLVWKTSALKELVDTM